jgi:hypothetical protein
MKARAFRHNPKLNMAEADRRVEPFFYPERTSPRSCRAAAQFNKRVERTAAERFGFDVDGFMNIIGHILSALSAAVAHSCR